MCVYRFVGDTSLDSHARFNLSPVPSVEDDEDDGVGHETHRGLNPINQDDSGEEADLTGNGPSGGTTTVTLYDKNDGISSPPPPSRHQEQGFYFS